MFLLILVGSAMTGVINFSSRIGDFLMKEKVKKWWSDFKTFDWKMYLALCLLALVPAIYQTIVTKLITSTANPGALDIVGQMEWFDLMRLARNFVFE